MDELIFIIENVFIEGGIRTIKSTYPLNPDIKLKLITYHSRPNIFLRMSKSNWPSWRN